MEFTKYHKYGAYHWSQYDKGTKYKAHADRIKEWVKEDSVLDIGAGDGKITSLLGAVGIDNEPEAVRLAQQKGVQVEYGSAYNLNYPDSSFDSITMIDTLEHLEEPIKALKEARRVLRNYLYIATPPHRDGKIERFHYHEWTPKGLVDLVESIGFKLVDKVEVIEAEKCMYAKFAR